MIAELNGEQKANTVESSVMARRPDIGKREHMWTREDLKEIVHNLSLLSEHGVREFYQRAYRECAIINSHTFPPTRALQELVQAWKQLRKWRKP
jgi:PP-loop superfamily ATP-utilizing enzyme